MEAMQDGGNLFIDTSLSRHSLHSKPRAASGPRSSYQTEVEIFIEDNGPGIPQNERKNIFEPFFSTKEKGTGLGLAVSFGIITAHGGSLELLDTLRHGEGNGACFRITLPIVENT